jgi:AcrR family transcriptional regulator
MEIEEKPNRNERRRRRTRDIILDAADAVFSRKGVDNATVNDITDEADVAYGTFYNHFRSMDTIVTARIELIIQRVAHFTNKILSEHTGRVELLPCVGSRVMMRVLMDDPAIRWIMDRPYIFVNEMYKIASPMMRGAEAEAVADGRFKPAAGHECWLRMYPWLLLAELREALNSGETALHEERFVLISLRFLGIDDNLAATLVDETRDFTSTLNMSMRGEGNESLESKSSGRAPKGASKARTVT